MEKKNKGRESVCVPEISPPPKRTAQCLSTCEFSVFTLPPDPPCEENRSFLQSGGTSTVRILTRRASLDQLASLGTLEGAEQREARWWQKTGCEWMTSPRSCLKNSSSLFEAERVKDPKKPLRWCCWSLGAGQALHRRTNRPSTPAISHRP